MNNAELRQLKVELIGVAAMILRLKMVEEVSDEMDERMNLLAVQLRNISDGIKVPPPGEEV